MHSDAPDRIAKYKVYKRSRIPVIQIISVPADYKHIKTLKGIKKCWKGGMQYWTAPATNNVIQKLKKWKFVFDDRLKIFTLQIQGLKGTLKFFQKEGVLFIQRNKGRALLADEMGLGKTIQALAWLQLNPSVRPAIIVVPASLKLNWCKEAASWITDKHIQLLQGRCAKYDKTKLEKGIIVINYEILNSWVNKIRRIRPKVLILDEVHFIKNKKAKRSRAVRKLAKGVDHLIAISGTPITNRPIEFFNILNLINNNLFADFWEYAWNYCNPKHTRFGWNFTGSRNTKELHDILTKSIMIRRKKSEVIKELPPITRTAIPLEIDNRTEYENAKTDIIQWIKQTKGDAPAKKAERAAALIKLQTLLQLTSAGKMQAIMEWVENFLETEEKLILFVTHTSTIKTLMNKFKDVAVRMDGKTSMQERDKAVTEFQNNPNVKLFIGMIDTEGKPAGVGITLTAASNMAFAELQLSPYVHDQAEGRPHRIGQRNAVNAYYLLATNTIEDNIATLLDAKRKVLDKILDGKDTTSENLLTELLKELEKEGSNGKN